MHRIIASAVAVVLAAACLAPSAALAAEHRQKTPAPDGRAAGRWELPKPKGTAHPDVEPSSAGGTGDGYNPISFTYFDSGDIVVVLGTATGHAGLFDRAYYTGLYSYAVWSANTSPRNGVQREQCIKYRTYDEAYGLWVPSRAASGSAVRYYARRQEGEPYNIASSKADQTRWYCSKLAWAAWRYTTGLDLDGDGGYWVWPVDLVRSARVAVFGHWS